MGFFKRLCLFVFGLAGLLALAALVSPWYGPWKADAVALLGIREYFVAVEAAAAIAALGLLVCLLRSIFVRNRKSVIVSRSKGDQITVSMDAIASQVAHVIEEDGLFKASHVRVRAKKHGHVRAAACVQPMSTVDVIAAGSELHDRLVTGLTTIVGDNVDAVDLEFITAVEYSSSAGAQDDSPVQGESGGGALGAGDATGESSPADTGCNPSDTSEITVSMARYATEQPDERDTMEEE